MIYLNPQITKRCNMVTRPHDRTWPYRVTERWQVQVKWNLLSQQSQKQIERTWSVLQKAHKIYQPTTIGKMNNTVVAGIQFTDNYTITSWVDDGFLHDFASMPGIVRVALMLKRDDPRIAEATVIHDAWCKLSRWWAWRCREKMVSEGAHVRDVLTECRTIYQAARFFGDNLAASIAYNRGLGDFRGAAFYYGMRFGSKVSNYEASTH